MEKHRIVITGVGVVAPNGIGKDEFWANCRAGVSGIKPVTLFSSIQSSDVHPAGEIHDFQPQSYLGTKGLRNLDRTTLLGLVAAKLAVEDAGLAVTEANSGEIGVVLGSTMGSVHSISSFDLSGIREGPRYVNPALFPNTVINSPASQISIRMGIKGLNTTIAMGFTASIQAIEYAVDMLRLGRVSTVVVGGVEELCEETSCAFSGLGLLSGNRSKPMSSKASGLATQPTLGEGAGLLVLETLEGSRMRNVTPYAEILEATSMFSLEAAQEYSLLRDDILKMLHQAFSLSDIEPENISHICTWSELDGKAHPEMDALEIFFGKHMHSMKLLETRGLVGECFSAMGALQVIRALGEERVMGAGMLINTLSPLGIYASLIMRSLEAGPHRTASQIRK